MEEFCEGFSSKLRCLSPEFVNEEYFDDECITKTSVDQVCLLYFDIPAYYFSRMSVKCDIIGHK